MDREEEKDLYIKSKIKDSHIPEKIDDLFNNSIKLAEMESVENSKDKKDTTKKKTPIIVKRIAAVAACAVIALGGGNIYATTRGYDNVFFMIKELITSNEASGKDAILSDRDITISYKSIEIAKGIKMQINRLVIKDNEAKLYLKIDKSTTELDITPFTYIVKDGKGKELCNYESESQEVAYTEELILKNYKNNTNKLELEVLQNNGEIIAKFEIDLEKKEIQIIGNEKELKKISEEELKKYLNAFALLNFEDDELNSGTLDKDVLENKRKILVAKEIAKLNNIDIYISNSDSEIDMEKLKEIVNSFSEELEDGVSSKIDENITALCLDVTDIMYSQGIYTVTFTYCYPTYNSSGDGYEEEIDNLPVYEMTIGLTINEDQTYSKYRVSSKMESNLVKSGNAADENTDMADISERCKEALEKYLLLSGKSEGSPESVLEELNLMTYQEFEELRQNEENIQDGYIKIECKYSKFKEMMLEYMTEDLYENMFSRKYKEIDGYLGVLNGGATGISFEIKNMELKSSEETSYTYKVQYIEDPSNGETQEMLVILEYTNKNYVVSKIEYVKNEDETIITDEALEKFIKNWNLSYIMQNGYEQLIKNVYGDKASVTLEIQRDGKFIEKIFSNESVIETSEGKYTKINDNSLKLEYDNGYVSYIAYETNSLDEIVISRASIKNSNLYEYYISSEETNDLKENLVGTWWRTYNVDHEESYEFYISFKSDGTFSEATMKTSEDGNSKSPQPIGQGTYKFVQEYNWDKVILTYEDGEEHVFLYGTKGSNKENQPLHYSEGQQVFRKFMVAE